MKEILSEKLITNAEAREILKTRSKEIELGYEQKNAFDHLKKFEKLTENNANKLVENLKEVKKLRENQIYEIVNILPRDLDDLRILLGKEYNNLTEEEKTLILDHVKKFI